SAKGYKLVDLEAYQDGTSLKWAGVWNGTGSYLLNRNYDTAPFTDLRRQRNSSGWKLTNIESYMVGSTRKWAGIWEKSTDSEQFQFNRSFGRFIYYHNNNKKYGYELIDMDRMAP